MSVTLSFQEGSGCLMKNQNKQKAEDPDLVGWIDFVLETADPELKPRKPLRLTVAAWIMQDRSETSSHYSLDVGGIPAKLFPEQDGRISRGPDHPDYAGHFAKNCGLGDQLRIAGWKKISREGARYISLAVSPRRATRANDAPADQREAPQSSCQMQGIPGFDFV